MPFLVCCVFAYWLVKHLPELAGEAVSEWQHARRGEESPAAAARRARLEGQGVDPAAGGAFGQYVGNLWRDFWLDQDSARARRRSDPAGGAGRPGPGARLRSAFDREVGRRARAWQRRTGNTQAPPATDPGAAAPQVDDATTPEPGSSTGTAPDGSTPPTDPGPSTDPTQPDGPSPDPTSPGQGPARPPVFVAATVGDPITEPGSGGTATAVLDRPPALPAPTERTPDMTQAVATNQTAVTGVVSGAAEARAIVRYLEQATQAYEAAMAAARRRIHALGEQTVGTVQMATRSRVVDATAQAAESIAAAQAGANRCQAETIPLLGTVAREFDRINS